MNSRPTRQFWELYAELPPEIQAAADKAFILWREDPAHPSLRFKKVGTTEPIYSARITAAYRALGWMEGDTVHWYWIGPHTKYERKLR